MDIGPRQAQRPVLPQQPLPRPPGVQSPAAGDGMPAPPARPGKGNDAGLAPDAEVRLVAEDGSHKVRPAGVKCAAKLLLRCMDNTGC